MFLYIQNDPQTLLKCMTIASEMLQSVGLKTLTPTLQTLIETLVGILSYSVEC